jgi:hypothetical protein
MRVNYCWTVVYQQAATKGRSNSGEGGKTEGIIWPGLPVRAGVRIAGPSEEMRCVQYEQFPAARASSNQPCPTAK